MGQPIIVCFHGFFGQRKDWANLPWSSRVHVESLDLWRSFKACKPRSLSEWASEIQLPEGPVWAVGYSMGGRLLMHALVSRPQSFCGAVLVSSHPGLTDQEEREARIENDLVWVDKIRTQPWADLIEEWRAQAVFQSSVHWQLSESDFDRETLAEVMNLASLGRQENMRAHLDALDVPLLWLAGEKDPKFSTLLSTFSSENSAVEVWPGAGHRLPWDQPLQFTQRVEKFVLSQGKGGVYGGS